VRVGVVDIGTNTVRLLVADVDGLSVTDIHRESVVVGLGTGVDRAGRFDPAAIARTLASIDRFGDLLESAGPVRRRAVATSASRDAADAPEVLARIADRLGVAPEVITGSEEAALSFVGATTGLPGPSPSLVIDPGGGSTEFVVGADSVSGAASIDIGSVRLTERHLPDRPATRAQLEAARVHVSGLFAAVPRMDAARVIGVGGTFTTLGAIDLGLAVHDRGRVHGTRVPLRRLDAIVERLAALTVEATAAIPSLDPGRAPVLLAGAVVAAEAIRQTGHAAVSVSEADLLDGLAVELASSA
jgi:exopolyphosphatase / guanosine-5'-triphosphate,3'-diphosphate pyrophosphatase